MTIPWPRAGLLCAALLSAASAAPLIEWDASTRNFACAGTYARVKRLSSGILALVYSRGANACIRFSEGAAWGPETVVAAAAGYGYTNAELAEAAEGRLVYAWNGRPSAGTAGKPWFIATKSSQDGGKSWSAEARAYTAGSVAGEGCWEPALLRLPDGGLQLYFANEGPYPDNADQEIGMLASIDAGRTWSGYRAVSHRAGHRDGMPVPVHLGEGKGIAVAIEDNGIEGAFKPALLRSGPGGEWGAPVAGTDPRRSLAVRGDLRPAAAVYAGAPYLARLPGGIQVLSCQSTEGRTPAADPVAHAIMQVYTADAESGFGARTTPFPVPEGGQGVWNSLAVLDDSTVMAVSAVRGMGMDGIWTVTGRVRGGAAAVIALPARTGSAMLARGFPIRWRPDGRIRPALRP